MPFHSVQTEREARNLILLHCPLGYDKNYRVRVDWSEDDIIAAMRSATRQFGVENEYK